MKQLALLFLLLSVLLGKAWGYGMPPIYDPELLTATPMPIPHHHHARPTMTATPLPATPLPAVTFTPTAAPTLAPTLVPTLVQTVTATPSPAYDLRGLNSFREQGFLEVGLGADLPVQGSTLPGNPAGGKVAAGIVFKDGLAVQLDLEFFNQSSTALDISKSSLLVLPTLSHYLMAGGVRPYLSISDGLSLNTTTSGTTRASTNSFDLALGGGVEFMIDQYFSIYLEGKYNFVFMSNSPNQDIPLVIGARLGL